MVSARLERWFSRESELDSVRKDTNHLRVRGAIAE
jgi:hypothetical protein